MLQIEGLSKRFGGLVAVDDLSFQAPRNTILGMIGVNGAGKTTVMNCISGLYSSDTGRITLDGKDITNKTPHDIAHHGLGRTFQVPRVFRRMTLIENLLSTVLDSPLSDAELVEQATSILDEVQLHELRYNYAEELSGGQQKLLELARVMMFDPGTILLDEPFAGVNPGLCKILIERIESLVDAGKTFLLISHDLTSIYRLSHHIVVLNQGQKIAEGNVEDIKNNPQVIEAYLGN
ncbi:MAG: ABC transporter ATP-binding protein [Alphaproteobacteria bacterium]|jgi:branched-chain amino acid transport system ATP-binding protein|nr:ABC transporter ATP-binding protein [Alphaproteobacteria bacterium]